MNPEVIPSSSLPDAPHVSAADSSGADTDAISLAELNNILGKNYSDRETALKAVKETYTFIGKRDDHARIVKEAVQKTGKSEDEILQLLTNSNMPENGSQPANPDQFITKDQYLEDMFFSKNPDLSMVKDVIKPLKNSDEFKSMSWDDYVKSDKIASIVDTFRVANEVKSAKSVMESNPRIGSASNKLQSAQQAMEAGNYTAAKENAISAVMEAFRID